MLEQMIYGYEQAFEENFQGEEKTDARPKSVRFVMQRAARRSWRHLAKERIEKIKPYIPLGKQFWPITENEHGERANAIDSVIQNDAMRRLVTLIRSRKDNARIDLLDAGYWVKGCSSLGLLRYAVLLGIDQDSPKSMDFCLMDIKVRCRSCSTALSKCHHASN